MSSMEKDKKIKKRRLYLNKKLIAQTALNICDDEGLEALSFRKLAKELSCEAMSLYYYYESKGDLLDAIADLMYEEVVMPLKNEGNWLEKIKKISYSYRNLGKKHPKVFQILTNRRANNEGSFKFLDSFFSFLLDEDFTPLEVSQIFRTIGFYLNGAILAEIAISLTGNDPTLPVLEQKEKITSFPTLLEVSPYLGEKYFDLNFEFGLNLILKELEKLKPITR